MYATAVTKVASNLERKEEVLYYCLNLNKRVLRTQAGSFEELGEVPRAASPYPVAKNELHFHSKICCSLTFFLVAFFFLNLFCFSKCKFTELHEWKT